MIGEIFKDFMLINMSIVIATFFRNGDHNFIFKTYYPIQFSKYLLTQNRSISHNIKKSDRKSLKGISTYVFLRKRVEFIG